MTKEEKLQEFNQFKAQVFEWRDAHETEYLKFVDKMNRVNGIFPYIKLYILFRIRMGKFHKIWKRIWSGAEHTQFKELDKKFDGSRIAKMLVDDFQMQRGGNTSPLILSWMLSGDLFETVLEKLDSLIKTEGLNVNEQRVILWAMDYALTSSYFYRTKDEWADYAHDLSVLSPKSVALSRIRIYIGENTSDSETTQVQQDEAIVSASSNAASAPAEAMASTPTIAQDEASPKKRNVKETIRKPLIELLHCSHKPEIIEYIRTFLTDHRSAVDCIRLLKALNRMEIYTQGTVLPIFHDALLMQYPDISIRGTRAFQYAYGAIGKDSEPEINKLADEMTKIIEEK